MKTLFAAILVAVALAGCSGESAQDKALDSASPMANVPSPPPPAGKGRATPPPSMGAPAGPSAAGPAPAPAGG